jgi:Phosphatidylethanolamine-binding protein
LISSAFANGGAVPRRHSCEGEDLSPPLEWAGVPGDAVSLALIVADPDAPVGTFTHWLGWGMHPKARGLAEDERAPWEGRNDFARSAIGDRVRRAAMGRTGTSSVCTRWRANRPCQLALPGGSLNARSGTTSSRSPSFSAPTSGERAGAARGPASRARASRAGDPRSPLPSRAAGGGVAARLRR